MYVRIHTAVRKQSFYWQIKTYNYPRDLNYNWLVSPKDRGAAVGFERGTSQSLARHLIRITTGEVIRIYKFTFVSNFANKIIQASL